MTQISWLQMAVWKKQRVYNLLKWSLCKKGVEFSWMRSLVTGVDAECFETKLIQDSKHAV